MNDLKVTVPHDRIPGLRITRFLAIAYAAVAAIVSCYTAAQDLLAEQVLVSLPVAPFFPKTNPTLKTFGPTATVTGGGYDHASLTLSGLHPDARLWLAGGTLLQGATAVLIAYTLAVLCVRVAQGEPFAKGLVRGINQSAIAILVGGLLWQVAFQVGQALAFNQAFYVAGASWSEHAKGITPYSAYWPQGNTSFSIDFWPIGIGLAFFAIAAVFRYGQRLERDRELLRRDRAALQHDVEGLV